MHDLFIHEQVLLLLVNDDDGLVEFPARLTATLALAGASVVDLARLGRVSLTDNGIEVRNEAPAGVRVLDQALALLAARPKARTIEHCARELTAHTQQLSCAGDRLVERGVLGFEQKTLLWVFKKTRFEQLDGTPERALRDRIGAVLAGEPPDEALRVVLGAVGAIRLLPLLAKQEGWILGNEAAIARGTRVSRLATRIVTEGMARTRSGPGLQS